MRSLALVHPLADLHVGGRLVHVTLAEPIDDDRVREAQVEVVGPGGERPVGHRRALGPAAVEALRRRHPPEGVEIVDGGAEAHRGLEHPRRYPPGFAAVHCARVGRGTEAAAQDVVAREATGIEQHRAPSAQDPLAARQRDANPDDAIAFDDELRDLRLGDDRDALAQGDLEHPALDRRAVRDEVRAEELRAQHPAGQAQRRRLAPPGPLRQIELGELMTVHRHACADRGAGEPRRPGSEGPGVEERRHQAATPRLAPGPIVVVVGPAFGSEELHASRLQESDHRRADLQERLAPGRRGPGPLVGHDRVEITPRAIVGVGDPLLRHQRIEGRPEHAARDRRRAPNPGLLLENDDAATEALRDEGGDDRARPAPDDDEVDLGTEPVERTSRVEIDREMRHRGSPAFVFSLAHFRAPRNGLAPGPSTLTE
jgi:hypothetical protein